ncbi:MAG: chemotaxis-specific protein-glutamate methyltransferase CheB [Waddliaceae bacterium]|nr:chemotaxis-specific protein-glutamate methyltransferase CheB [Waddliaceae bacterium]
MDKKIKVLVVDDSALVRGMLTEILNTSGDIEVVDTAKNGEEGVKKALSLKPDVITMDITMPIMGGFEAIERIMQEFPIPIIAVSGMEAKTIMKALDVGAMDFISVKQDVEDLGKELVEKIKVASKVKPLKRMKKYAINKGPQKKKSSATKVVVIGISTGGPQTLEFFLSKFPEDFPIGFVVAQHMTEGFIKGFAEWLGTKTALNVKVAEEGEIVAQGTILIAPDDSDMEIGEGGIITCVKGERDYGMSLIDTMMKSAAKEYGENTVGVIMTGMGRDGVEGMQEIKAAGGITIAQDEQSSAIFGMNAEAIKTGCIDVVVSLENIYQEIIKATQGKKRQKKKVLIIEDSPTVLEMMAAAFEGEGYDVTMAETGEEGLEKLKDHDLMIVDTILPGIDGFEVCRNVKKEKGLAKPKVLVVTGNIDAFDAKKARDAGADDYVVKTSDFEHLIEVAEKLL